MITVSNTTDFPMVIKNPRFKGAGNIELPGTLTIGPHEDWTINVGAGSEVRGLKLDVELQLPNGNLAFSTDSICAE